VAYYARDFRLEKLGSAGPLLFILLPALLGIYLLYAATHSGGNISAAIKNVASREIKPNPLFLDQDEDGLKNWEEKIYGLNPNNEDSDGDGIFDRDEVLRGSLAAESGNGSVLGASTDGSAKNLTEELFVKFMDEGGALALSKGSKNTFLASGLLTKEIERLSAEGAIPRPIPTVPLERMPIVTSDDMSPEAVRAYLNETARIIATHSQGLPKDNLDLLVEILRSGQFELLPEFARYREAADAIARELEALPVPKTLAWYHGKQIFLMREMARHIAAFEATEQDPLKTLALVEPNIQVKEELLNLNRYDLWNWLRKENITLTPADNAYKIVY